jgi:hypothetical protein
MGSTVIVLWPRGAVRWAAELASGSPLRVGKAMGTLA